MGGGAAIRAAAKAAGVGVMSSGIRGGFPSSISSPAEHSVRSAKRPVSAIISSSQQSKTSGSVEIEGFQRPAFEIDDWEFAGVEPEEYLFERDEPLPRVVFGGPPTIEEAKAATSEVKDALEKMYLSSPATSDGLFGDGGQLSGLSLLTNSDCLETKSCVTCDAKEMSAPRHAIRAFTLLNENPQAQSVVASIATDPNVWDAVFKNEALQEYLLSQKTNAELRDPVSPRISNVSSDDASQAEKTENKPIDIFESIKNSVTEMMSNVSTFVQQMFGYSPAESISETADANEKSSFFDKSLGASFMALAVTVIMVVVLKRG